MALMVELYITPYPMENVSAKYVSSGTSIPVSAVSAYSYYYAEPTGSGLIEISATGYEPYQIDIQTDGEYYVTLTPAATPKYVSKISDGTNTYIIKDSNAVHTEDVTSTYSPTGTSPINGTAVASAISSKSNIDLSDLSQTGKNIGNWCSNISNCIIEIPQDIKLELSSGTLKLKSGSKCYTKSDTTTPSISISSDLSTTQTTNGTYFAIYNGSGLTTILTTEYTYSSLPSTYSLPLALITVSGGVISSIDQVFNGFGFIGSTAFTLPGIKGLVPDGRNSDGSLHNSLFTSSVLKTVNATGTHTDYYLMLNAANIWLGAYTHNYEENQNYSSAGNPVGRCMVTPIQISNGSITSLTPKKVFRAVSYEDVIAIVQSMLNV